MLLKNKKAPKHKKTKRINLCFDASAQSIKIVRYHLSLYLILVLITKDFASGGFYSPKWISSLPSFGDSQTQTGLSYRSYTYYKTKIKYF